MSKIYLFIGLIFITQLNIALANSDTQVEQLLKQEIEPFGVIFEIVESDDNALQWAIPKVTLYSKKLQQRFPGIGLAVVTHGTEQFGLMKSEQKNNPEVHQQVQSLVAKNIPVHVCATHASWLGKEAEDFPDYVDVTPAGPTEIRNYEAMGYVLIVIEQQ
jgi:intracellular sulfur oxidation DsrE/DsrF family protein